MWRISQPERGVNGRGRSSPANVQIWHWTDAVARSDVPPLCKLILLNIARHLSQVDGKGWPITIKQMQKETGLANGSLAKHIEIAKGEGLLEVVRQYDDQGHRTATIYIARLPESPGDPQRPKPEADPSARDASRERDLNARDASSLDAGGEGLDAPGGGLSAPAASQESSQSSQSAPHASPPNLFKPGAGDQPIPFEETDEEDLSSQLIPIYATRVRNILQEGVEAAARKKFGIDRLPFSATVLRKVSAMGVDPVKLVLRYFEKTNGQTIRNPNGYLFRMARRERADRDGVSVAVFDTIVSTDLQVRANAMAVGVKRELPAWMKQVAVNRDRSALMRTALICGGKRT